MPTNGQYKGDGYINICLAVLALAATDARKGEKSKLWEDFTTRFDIKNRNVDPLTIAVWVGSWIMDNVKKRR